MLDRETQLCHLSEILEILRLGSSATFQCNGEQKISEGHIIRITIARAAKVTSGLVNILSSPESAVGTVDIDSQASTLPTGRWIGLMVC